MPEDPTSKAVLVIVPESAEGRAEGGALPPLAATFAAAGLRAEVCPAGPDLPAPSPDTALVVVADGPDATLAIDAWIEQVRGAGVPVLFDGASAAARTASRVRELEGRLTEARRHEVVGRLVGGVAHDFNNVLSVVSTLSELMLRFGEDEDPNREDLEEILAAARRGSELTRQLQAFARADVGEGEVVDLGARLSGAEKLVRKLLPADIDATLQSGASVPEVWLDPVEADQVVFNLTAHGRWHLPAGGSLRLATETGPAGAPMITLDLAPRPHAEKNPAGAAPEREPGAIVAGLVAVEEVVRRRGGTLRVVDHETGAVRIEVEFRPLTSKEAEPSQSTAAEIDARGRVALVVEDDEVVRAALGRALSSMGFTVRSAGNASEALDVLGAEPADVVVCDAVLPGSWGLGLRAKAHEAGHAPPFVFLSGHDGHPAVDAVRKAELPLLRKPVAAATLERAVADALTPG